VGGVRDPWAAPEPEPDGSDLSGLIRLVKLQADVLRDVATGVPVSSAIAVTTLDRAELGGGLTSPRRIFRGGYVALHRSRRRAGFVMAGIA
jgi:hypothetical protein